MLLDAFWVDGILKIFNLFLDYLWINNLRTRLQNLLTLFSLIEALNYFFCHITFKHLILTLLEFEAYLSEKKRLNMLKILKKTLNTKKSKVPQAINPSRII